MSPVVDRIDEVFWEAAQRAPGAERQAYLATACGDDRKLRQRVEQLLSVQPRVEAFLEQPFAGPAPTIHSAETPGCIIGPYKLLEQIGEGGMGLVFMAEQTEPIRRKVALKIIKPGMDTRQVVARFEAERQALALMDHPNIAKILDAGSTGEPTEQAREETFLARAAGSRPYFVMELVRGVPITEFCDQHRYTPRQRLALFVTVCQAVQHAHQKGIIHRDLKPSNILVTLHDTLVVPKIIDFGIAKATEQPLTERTMFTNFAQMIGTPAYMSPEQAEMNSLDIDTRSDVYSLGVLLYELLTGTTPFDSEKLKQAGFDEMRRLIREQDPPRPSQRISTLEAQALTTLTERRGVDALPFTQSLRGELDWIVMKALDKDRTRRYESAGALAADVQRHVNDEPVEACPPTAWYWVRKFAGRHKVSLAAGIVVAVALVAATGVSVWLALEATKARREATTDAAIASAVSNFLQEDLLGQAETGTPLGQDFGGSPYLTVKDALDRASARIGQRFQDQPLVEAAIRTTIGRAYLNLDEHQHSVPHLERAVALRSRLGLNDNDLFSITDDLAATYSFVGRFSEAITLRQQLFEHKRTLLGPEHLETLACMERLGNSYGAAGQWNLYVPLLQQVLEKRRAIQGVDDPATIRTMVGIGLHYLDCERVSESVTLFQFALERLPPTTPAEKRIFYMLCLGNAYYKVGKLDQSERLHRDALDEIAKQPDSLWRRVKAANASGWLARTLLAKERPAEAEQLIRAALTFYDKHRSDNWGRFYLVNLLGAVLACQQKYDEAEHLLLQGYEGMRDFQAIRNSGQRRRLAQAGERVVRFYEVTGQMEKARTWRDKLADDTRTGGTDR